MGEWYPVLGLGLRCGGGREGEGVGRRRGVGGRRLVILKRVRSSAKIRCESQGGKNSPSAEL